MGSVCLSRRDSSPFRSLLSELSILSCLFVPFRLVPPLLGDPLKGLGGATDGDDLDASMERLLVKLVIFEIFQLFITLRPLWTTRIFHPDTSHNNLTLDQVLQRHAALLVASIAACIISGLDFGALRRWRKDISLYIELLVL